MNPWRTCARKHRFESHAEAEQQRVRYEETGEAGLVVYQCLYCWYYHLGHLTPRLLGTPRQRQASKR